MARIPALNEWNSGPTEKKISPDHKRRCKEVQKMTDEEIRRMEELSHRKEAEVMQV